MSLKPLDLQTLFGHMNEVGKNQSMIRDSMAAQQAFEAKKQIEQELEKDSSVNRTAEDQEAGKVDEQGQPGEQNQKKRDSRRGENPSEEREEIRDPDLGQNIDLMG